MCGLWGVLAVGLFADGTYGNGWNGIAGGVKGLFSGDGGQLLAKLMKGSGNGAAAPAPEPTALSG